MKLIIYGNGRIARIIYQYVKNQFEVVSFTVQDDLLSQATLEGLPIRPFENIEHELTPADHAMLIAVGYVQMNGIRRQKYEEAKAKGYTLANYVHPSVHRHDDVSIGEGNMILDQVSIQPGARLGNNNFIWSNVVIAHGCTIEDDCWVTSGVTIAGDTTIKSGGFLGVNSTIGHNLTLGEQNFIGANALVTKSTGPNEAYIAPGAEKIRLDSHRFLKFSEV
tara:strand:- start:305 stop:967 length:663 start_codon:yes stop_codon:yes gene_type:complete